MHILINSILFTNVHQIKVYISVTRQNTRSTVPPVLELCYWSVSKPHPPQPAPGFVQRLLWQHLRVESPCSPATDSSAAPPRWLWGIRLVGDETKSFVDFMNIFCFLILIILKLCEIETFSDRFVFLFWSKVCFRWHSTSRTGSEDKWADVPTSDISVINQKMVLLPHIAIS